MKLIKYVLCLCLAFGQIALAKTEKAIIMLYPEKIPDFYSQRDYIRKEIKKASELYNINERDNQPYMWKLYDVHVALRKKVADIKSTQVLAKMMVDSPVLKAVAYGQGKPNYSMPYRFHFIKSDPPVIKFAYEIINDRTGEVLFVNQVTVYPYAGKQPERYLDDSSLKNTRKQFMAQSVDSIVTQIWRNALNQIAKTPILATKVEKNLDDFHHFSNSLRYVSHEAGIADEIANGSETGTLKLNLKVKSSFLPPLRKFELSAQYGHFIAGNNNYAAIKGEQQTVILVPRDTKKFITKNDKEGKPFKKLANKGHLEFTYKTFDCHKTGQAIPPPEGVNDFDKTHYTWYKERFTFKLVDKLSLPRDETLLTKEVYFKCPKLFYTAEVKFTIRRTELHNDPEMGNIRFKEEDVTTHTTRQVLYFDLKKRQIVNVSLQPFGHIVKDFEDYTFDKSTCKPVLASNVDTELDSSTIMSYMGHLGVFTRETPMLFSLPWGKTVHFSLNKLWSSGFSYDKTEQTHTPEIEIFPAVPNAEHRQQVHMVLETERVLQKVFADNPCEADATIDWLHEGIDEGFATESGNEVVEYNVKIRPSSKGEIKLFDKQKKKPHAKPFIKTTAPKDIYEISPYVKALQDDVDFFYEKRERIPFEEAIPMLEKSMKDILAVPNGVGKQNSQ